MKKKLIAIGALIFSLFMAKQSEAAHKWTFTDAGNITSGSLADGRLSVNVTTQGQFNDGTKALNVATVTANVFFSTAGNINLIAVNTNYLNLGTTNNINGGATFYGDLTTLGKLKGDGSLITGLSANSPSTSSVKYAVFLSTFGNDTNTISLSAKALDIMGSYFANVSTRCSLALAGAGGLDTGSEAASTWYNIFAITNGSTISVVVSSISNTAPTLPSGYTKYRWLGTVYNKSDSAIRPFYKIGSNVGYWQTNTFFSGSLSANTNFSLDTLLPPRPASVKLWADLGDTSASFESNMRIVFYMLGQADDSLTNVGYVGTAFTYSASVDTGYLFSLDVFESRTLKVLVALGTVSLDQFRLTCYGYTEEDI